MAKKKTEPATAAVEPEKEWEVTTERFVAFFDIMGFKDRVDKNSHEKVLKDLTNIKDTLNIFERDVLGLDENPKRVKTAIFSDSIILFTEDNSPNSLFAISMCACFLIADTIKSLVPIKGIISVGKITADLENSIFFGKPIINSYLLNEELNFYAPIPMLDLYIC